MPFVGGIMFLAAIALMVLIARWSDEFDDLPDDAKRGGWFRMRIGVTQAVARRARKAVAKAAPPPQAVQRSRRAPPPAARRGGGSPRSLERRLAREVEDDMLDEIEGSAAMFAPDETAPRRRNFAIEDDQ